MALVGSRAPGSCCSRRRDCEGHDALRHRRATREPASRRVTAPTTSRPRARRRATRTSRVSAARRCTPDGVTGAYQAESTWNESEIFDDAVAGGGGESVLFGRPVLPGGPSPGTVRKREVPDVSYNAAVFHGVIVAVGRQLLPLRRYELRLAAVGRRSARSSNQIARPPASATSTPALYMLGEDPGRERVPRHRGRQQQLTSPTGSAARSPASRRCTGYDMATGIGSPNASNLLPAIAKPRQRLNRADEQHRVTNGPPSGGPFTSSPEKQMPVIGIAGEPGLTHDEPGPVGPKGERESS